EPSNAPEWYKNIKAVQWKTQPPLATGSQVAFKAKFLGKDLSYIYEITNYSPGERLVMRTAQGPFPMETTYTWSTIDSKNCEMTLRNAGAPSGFSKWLAPFMSMAMRRANRNDLQLIKSIMENQS
ncbi:MAG: SRPBCC family protein, partial [Ginsengibacter sp.]